MLLYKIINLENSTKDGKLNIVIEENMKKIYKKTNISETETTINVLYQENKLSIYTNKVALQKQLNKLIGEPTKEYKIKRSIVGSSWEISLDNKVLISRVVLKANVFEI